MTHASPNPARRPRPGRAGFTLTELLIVIAIMVIIMGLAVPAFKAMTGGRSVDAAANNLSAIVSRARTDAIGLQKTHGVLFYLDPATDKVTAMLVVEVPQPAGAPDPDAIYLDASPGAEFIALPVGVGLQVLTNAALTAATPPTRTSDGYIGFNPLCPGNATSGLPNTKVGGAVLFDSTGKLMSVQYRLMLQDDSPADPTVIPAEPTPRPSRLLKAVRGDESNNDIPGSATGTAIPATSALGTVGVVMYDLPDYRELPESNTLQDKRDQDRSDGTLNTGSYTQDRPREDWLDANGQPFLVARHSGALLRNR